jgi:hypothetical protein
MVEDTRDSDTASTTAPGVGTTTASPRKILNGLSWEKMANYEAAVMYARMVFEISYNVRTYLSADCRIECRI